MNTTELTAENIQMVTRAEFARRIGTEILGGKPRSRAWATEFFKKNPDLLNEDGKANFFEAIERYRTTIDPTRNQQRIAMDRRRGINQVPQTNRLGDVIIDDSARTKILDDVLEEIRRLDSEGRLNANKIGELTQKQQLIRTMYDAKLAELKYIREVGRSADIDDVISANAQIVTAIRAKLLALPPKMGPRLVSRQIHEIEERLRDSINEILSELNGMNEMNLAEDVNE